MYRLGDCFIGDYVVSEFFGSSPAVYNARYGTQGFTGIRIKCPTLTPILSAADGIIHEVSFEEAGKGKFIVIIHDGFKTTYAHLNDQLVEKGQTVIAGQLIGHSNQSGLAEYPCLYFSVTPCDAAGNNTEDNGYNGAIDPLGPEISWDVQNLKEPNTRANTEEKMTLTPKEYAALNAQATNYRVIVSYLKQKTEFDSFLVEQGRTPVSPEMTPDDPKGGEAVNLYLDTIADEFESLTDEITSLTGEEPPEEDIVKKDSYLVRFFHGVKRFIVKS